MDRARLLTLTIALFFLLLTGCQTPVRAMKPTPSPPTIWALSPVSGIPLPGRDDRPQPAGSGTNLRVLDWAGFEGAVSFSFDDTQPSQRQHWPEIQATGVRCTWYLSQTYGSGPGFEAVWKNAVASGHEIGNHTRSHLHVNNPGDNDDLTRRALGTTLAAAAAEELESCDRYIVGTLGQTGVWTLAYPFGDTAWKPYAGAYLFARTVANGLVPATGPFDPLLLPTFLVQAGMTEDVFNARIDGAAEARSWQTLVFHSLTPTDSNWFAGVPAAGVVASLEYGKGLGRVWLDSVVNVGAYWTAARLLKASVPRVAEGTTTWRWTLPRNFPPGKYLRVTVSGGTLHQGGEALAWNGHGFYEVSLDQGHLEWTP